VGRDRDFVGPSLQLARVQRYGRSWGLIAWLAYCKNGEGTSAALLCVIEVVQRSRYPRREVLEARATSACGGE
jgi:hypothetical protein